MSNIYLNCGPEPDAQATKNELVDFCCKLMAAFKSLKFIAFI